MWLSTVMVFGMPKLAVTWVLISNVTVQVGLAPLQPPPDHPVKFEFAPGASVNVTWVPGLKAAAQVDPQLIPEGVLVTVPVPAPVRVTLNRGKTLKVATADVFCCTVITQVAATPLHAPPHPVKVEFVLAVAVSVTWVPGLKAAAQVEPQLIPDGLLVTVPWPVPLCVMESSGNRLKVAAAEVFPFRVMVQVLRPLHAPPHPANIELPAGAAVSAT